MTTSYELKDVLVSVKDVSLKFDDKVILRPTSIEVRDVVVPGRIQGQVVGILGPSGIGKTQFSRILTGLQEPTTGTVHVAQVGIGPTAPLAPVRPGSIGMVFQNYRLFNHRTVMGNLMVALEHTKLTFLQRNDHVMSYLQMFELDNKAKLYPSQLSGGQRQRVAIIQALLCSEHFIVMDEPFTGLDPLMKDKVCDLINNVASLHEQNTIFVVAHDISALAAIADTLWLFGRDRDAQGNPIPGATIKTQYNLIELGLAWHPGISSTPEFHRFVSDVKAQFQTL